MVFVAPCAGDRDLLGADRAGAQVSVWARTTPALNEADSQPHFPFGECRDACCWAAQQWRLNVDWVSGKKTFTMTITKTQKKKADQRLKKGVRQVRAVRAKKKSGRPGQHDGEQLAAGEYKILQHGVRRRPRAPGGALQNQP